MVEAGVAPDVLVLNCLVAAKAHSQGTVAAREMLRLLLSQHSSLKPTAQTYAAIMQPCEHDGDMKTAFELYHEALAQEDTPLHIDLFNTLVTVCTRATDFAAAENIFNEMREKGVRPRSATYLKYIYACFRKGYADKAFDMLVQMESEWRIPEPRDYQRMLTQFRWANHAEGKARCLQGIMQDMRPRRAGEQGVSPEQLDPDVISGLFKEAQQRQQPEEVLKLSDALKNAGVKLDRFQQVGIVFAHLQLNQAVPAFSALIDLYDAGHSLPERAQEQLADELAKQASAVDEAYFLLESRKGEARRVPLRAVNMIIEACALMGDLDRAFATWAELDQLDLKPDAGTFNALLHTCVRTRELASGRRLLSRMAQDGVDPNATTFMHQTALHVMSREEGLALKMLQDCKEAGHTPNARMYQSLINMMVRARKIERAQDLVEEMRNDGHKVSAATLAKVQGDNGR